MVLLFAMSPVAFGQSKLPSCQGSDTKNWNKCQGAHTFSNDSKYVGEWKDGKRNGQGTLTFPSGSKYVGEFKNSKQHGQGTYTFASGMKYIGEWRDGKYHGQGILTYADGSKFDGVFKNGKPTEKITYESALPSCQGSDTSNWNRCQGTSTFGRGDPLAIGNGYDGEWKDGKRHGRGTHEYTNGNIYVGEWKDGKRNGHGAFTWTDGAKYVGEWKDGKPNGLGTFDYADGSRFVGEVEDGRRTDKGKFIPRCSSAGSCAFNFLEKTFND